MELWPFVALGLIGLAVGGGFIWRSLTSGPTRHEQGAKYRRIRRAITQDKDKQ